MTDKEKIRAEIERLQDGLMDAQGRFCTNAAESAYHILCHLENFINSMQEESKSKFEQSIQEGDNIVYNEELGCRVNLSQLKRVAKKEEPVSGDLEEAIDNYLKSYWGGEKEKQEWPFLKKMVIYFAQWQKEQMMAKAIDATCFGFQDSAALFTFRLPAGSYLVGSKVKIIVIKED